MPDDLTELDVRLRREAKALLSDRWLLALFAEYGTVHLSGSYALQLMTWRDLDIYMEAPNITVDEYFELGRQIYRLLTPKKMHFNDHRENLLEGGIKGLYWGLYLGDERKGAWKIDLWTFDSATCRNRLMHNEGIRNRLTPETRTAILEIKSLLWTHPEYRRSLASQMIYNAVLDAGVRDIEAFGVYVGDKLYAFVVEVRYVSSYF